MANRRVTQLVIEIEIEVSPPSATVGQFTADAIIGLNIADSGEGSSEVSIIHKSVEVADSGVGSSIIAISISGRRGQSTWW
jgi:hypothetical protein